MARNLLILLTVSIVLVFSSCSQASLYIKVIEGNYSYSRGEYVDANFNYVQAAKWNEYVSRISYDLGNVYHSLGESEAALEEWERASQAEEDPELTYRIAFNKGVLSYEMGRYQEAYQQFRHALKINPDDIEAKANLEYCLRKLNSRRDTTAKSPDSEGSEGSEQQLSGEGRRILEYVRRNSASLLKPDSSLEEAEDVKDW